MKAQEISESKQELFTLCKTIKESIIIGEYQASERLILAAMEKYPHAPEPHNLIGILLEKQGDHVTAMRHFRAAWALDPAYLPARENIDIFGAFSTNGNYIFEEEDCLLAAQSQCTSEYTDQQSKTILFLTAFHARIQQFKCHEVKL